MVKRLHDLGRLQVASVPPEDKRQSTKRHGGQGQANNDSHWRYSKSTNQFTRF
jgi:hypothetical protein